MGLCLLRVPVRVCRFFRQAKDADYLKRTLLAGLPPLPQRCMEIRMVSAAGLAQCRTAGMGCAPLLFSGGVGGGSF